MFCSTNLKMFRTLGTSALAFVAVLGLASVSQANNTPDVFIKINTKNGVNGNYSLDGNASSSFVGSLSLSFFNGSNQPVNLPNYTDPFDVFCIDIEDTINTNTLYASYIKSTNTYLAPNGSAAAWLYNNYVDAVVGNNHKSAGLQLAIWEVLYDWNANAIDLNNGRFKVNSINSNAKNFANQYLTAWVNSGYKTSDATWFDNYGTQGSGANRRANLNDPKQSLIGPRRVPEPGTMALLALGSMAFVAVRRRK
jgi:hypothetical protein